MSRNGTNPATASVREQEGAATALPLEPGDTVTATADLRPLGVTWFVVEEAA